LTKTVHLLSVLALAALTITIGITPVVQALPTNQANQIAKDVTNFVVPEHAVNIAPGIYSLGTTIHDGKEVQGILAFHHRTGHDGGPPGNNGDDDTTNTCFASFTKGATWRATESWILDPTNNAGLTEDFLKSELANNMATWEDPDSDDIQDFDIFGDVTDGVVDGADTISPDGKNEVYFADISTSGVIAVTITWYETRGPPQNRDIVEWDQIYDDADFEWSSAGEAGKMDFANIATHELGHALGLSHPNETCTLETMYAFADDGETIKRDLHDGDIAGVNDMYS